MITQYSITGSAWTAITSAGTSATAWLDEDNDGAVLQGKPSIDVRIFHTTGTPTDADITKGRRLYVPSGNSDAMIISADNSTDIYYARCKNAGDKAIVSVDA